MAIALPIVGQEISKANFGDPVANEVNRLTPLVDTMTPLVNAAKRYGYTATWSGTANNGMNVPWVGSGATVPWVVGTNTAVPSDGAGIYGMTFVINYGQTVGAAPWIAIVLNGAAFYSTMHPGGQGASCSIIVPLLIGNTIAGYVNPAVATNTGSSATMHVWRLSA